MSVKADQLLFSYGSLQWPNVQWQHFGRLLEGADDGVMGFRLGEIEVATSGSGEVGRYPILVPDQGQTQAINGKVFIVSADELAAADIYETSAYQRLEIPLLSGKRAWIYIQA